MTVSELRSELEKMNPEALIVVRYIAPASITAGEEIMDTIKSPSNFFFLEADFPACFNGESNQICIMTIEPTQT